MIENDAAIDEFWGGAAQGLWKLPDPNRLKNYKWVRFPNTETCSSQERNLAMKSLKIVGTGEHHLTKVLDAETGEDLGIKYGICKIEYIIGDKGAFPKGRLVLELSCPVIMDIR